MYIKKEPNKRKIILSITFFFDLIKRVDLIKDLPLIFFILFFYFYYFFFDHSSPFSNHIHKSLEKWQDKGTETIQ